MIRAFLGAAVAGLISFAVFWGLFTLVRRFPDDLDKGLVLVVIMPLLFLGSLVAGSVSGAVSGTAVAVLWTLAAVVMGLVAAALLLHPFDGADAAGTYAIITAFAALAAAVGHLIAVAFRPRVVRT